uniref:Uncharacterized protein n=1 Tax=Anguilla anguilla TaxID=7936 RepID=A0A0E9WDS9_ANGAN
MIHMTWFELRSTKCSLMQTFKMGKNKNDFHKMFF